MAEKRKALRLKEENEVTITVVSGRHNLSKEVMYNRSQDISASGIRIQAHLFLPVDTLLKIDITLKNVHQMITVMGKVKWIKIIYDGESYEEGVEFVNTADEAIKKLKDYISWKQKFNNLNSV